MTRRLLAGTCATVVTIGLGVQAFVPSRGEAVMRKPPRPRASATVTRAPVVTRHTDTADEAGLLGVVVALQSVELAARFDGTLERLDVHVGDRVKRGAPIARLDSRSIVQDLAIAEAALRVAEAEHDGLEIEWKDASSRRARLHTFPELFSREQIESADTQEQVAGARVRGSIADLAGKRARANQLREMLRDVEIVAPFDGTVAAQYVDPGSTVSRSTPIVRLISPGSLVIRFAVSEEQAAGLPVGRAVVVQIDSLKLTADAVVERIVPEIDAALRMVVVEARLADSAAVTQTVPTGAIARVLIPDQPDRHRPDLTLIAPFTPANDSDR